MSVTTDIAAITAQAATLDTLVTNYLAAKAACDAAELSIRQAQPYANHHAVAGRIRLAEHAIARMRNPSLPTCAALAASAWAGVS